ncbi:hypothetical protein M9434_003735 [Picochlorum sp. BPE23]|nr:hypothetical protein M9434_003735 [Picochlorum sp. BPE23]
MQKQGSLSYHLKAGAVRHFANRRVCVSRRRGRSDIGGPVQANSAAAIAEIPTRLNTIPHERSTRVGTLLECVREMATMLCKRHGGKVKVCVQQSLGTGVFQGTPLALSGVRRILLQMDWGEVSDQIEIGQLGRDQIDDCQTYILISPQNITGHSVLPLISEMVDEAHADKKEIIMVNPQLGDIMSSGGVMSVRGRQERMDFISTFTTAYHFRLLYIGMGPYPIMGALRYSYGGEWHIYKRVDFKGEDGSPQELYDMIQASKQEPDSSIITAAFKSSKA